MESKAMAITSPAPAGLSSRNTAARSPFMIRRMRDNPAGEIDVPERQSAHSVPPTPASKATSVTSRPQLTQTSTTGPEPSRARSLK